MTHGINRDDYMNGDISYQDYYMAIARAIDLPTLQACVRHMASADQLCGALATDPDLNSIPLVKWDRQDPAVRALVAHDATPVMAVSWSRRSTLAPGTFCWSLSDTVCTLKAVARDLVESRA